MYNEVYLGLGSNLGDRRANLEKGLELIGAIGKNLEASPIYETTPHGFASQPDFLNVACRIWTELSAFQLLQELANIESRLGRGRAFVNAPRTLDIDILIFGRSAIASPSLTIPHPRMHQREFVLRPLADIAPSLYHPTLNTSIRSLLAGIKESNHAIVQIYR